MICTIGLLDFLVKDGAVIQNICIEVFKVKNNLSPKTMKEIFPDRNYSGPNLNSQVDFEVPPFNRVNNGQESLRFLGPIVWEIPIRIKNSASYF